MLYKEYISIRDIALHKVGSNACQEGVSFSNETISLNNELNELLKVYFLRPFKTEEYFNLTHSSELNLNEIYHFTTQIFNQEESFIEVSKKIALYLYECSNHPNIKRGEIYVVYFENCILDGETIDAIGIFKSENKDKFIKIYNTPNGFGLEENEGISIKRLDKGCLIFNILKEEGYILSVVDNTNKSQGAEAKYWTDAFLHIKPRRDSFHQTNHLISMCRDFSESPMLNDGKLEKISFLSRVLENLSENCNNVEDLTDKLFDNEAERCQFSEFVKNYSKSVNIDLNGVISIDKEVLKKETKKKSIIRLDKSFEIRLLSPSKSNIIKGFDSERQKFFYTLFFNQES